MSTKKKLLAGLIGATILLSAYAADAAEPTAERIAELNDIKRQVAEVRAELEEKGVDTSGDQVVPVERKMPKPEKAAENQEKPAITESAESYAARIEKALTSAQTRQRQARPLVTEKPTVAQETPLIFSSKEEELYNFDWRGTPLAQSLYSVAKIAGKGIVVNGKLKSDTVYVSLNNVTCAQAMQYLAASFDLNWLIDGDNIVVSTDDKMYQSKVFNVNYVNKKQLRDEFIALGIKEDNIFANDETGTISVTGTPYQVAEAQKRLKALDHPVSQCLLLAQLVEINHGKNLDLGLSYTLPTYSHTGNDAVDAENPLKGKILGKLSFGVSSYANRELKKGRVIARPIVMSLNGQKGTVNFGDSVPVLTKTDTGSSSDVTVTYQDVGTKLEMTPNINEATGDISLNVAVEVSNITSWITSGLTRAPQMSKRTAETSAHIKSGQSLIIGGLMSKNEINNLSGIPGLMNLPILGALFSYRNRSTAYSEVYVMITPFIVSDDIDVQAMYHALDSKDGKYDPKKPKLNLDKNWTANLSSSESAAK